MGTNAVVAVSAPARDYAAMLLAYGAVEWTARTAVPCPEQGFEWAEQLPVDTCVRVIPVAGPGPGRRVYTGLFQGAFENHRGRVYELAGRMGPGGRPGAVSWLPVDAYQLQVLPWPDCPEDYAERQRFSEAFEVPPGADRLLQGYWSEFYGRCSLDCLLVGVTSTILAEAQAVVSASAAAGLLLQDLLRLRTVHSPGTHYRSVVLSSRGDPEDHRDAIRSHPPAVAVLDGAATARRWLGATLADVVVAVVERTGASAMAAADALYASRQVRTGDLAVPANLGGRIPPGVELLAWQTRGSAL